MEVAPPPPSADVEAAVAYDRRARRFHGRRALPCGVRGVYVLAVVQFLLSALALVSAVVFADRAALFGLCFLVLTHFMTLFLMLVAAFGLRVFAHLPVVSSKSALDASALVRPVRRLTLARWLWFGAVVLAFLAGLVAVLLLVQLVLILVGTWGDPTAPDASNVVKLVDEMRVNEPGLIIAFIVYSGVVVFLHLFVELPLFGVALYRCTAALRRIEATSPDAALLVDYYDTNDASLDGDPDDYMYS